MTNLRATHDSSRDVRLVLADVDGTLLTPGKVLTPRAHSAVEAVIKAGIADVQRAAMFVTSSNTEEGFASAMERFVLKADAA